MSYKFVLTLVFSIFLLGCKESIKLPEPSTQLYPEDLKFGSYQVGYKTLWTYDITRPAIPYSDWNGKLYPTKESTGRQFQINVWYPAASITKAQRLTIGDYMKLIFRQIDFEESSESIDFGKKELITKLIDLGSFDSLSALDLMKLENLTSKSYLDATPFKGQFPLILYPNGMAPFTNSIGAEYLSSHGFVVIGFTPKGQNKLTKDISTRGADVVSDDIKFVLSEVLQLPYVDAENIGIIANAVESSFSVGYQAQNRTLKSIVSLEGGFLSNFEQNILKDLPFYEPQNIDIPILAIYSPHPSIDPKYIKHLKYSKRHLAHFQDMREYDYLNFGMYNNLVANIIGEPKGDVSASYVKAHKLIKGFFEHTLTKQAPNFDLYFTTMEPTVSDSTYIWESIPSMPDLSIVKNNFINEGFSYIDSLYKAHKTYTKQPFSKNFINDFRIWVSWKKDAKYTARKNLYKMAIESYPKSAKMSFYLAHYSLKAGDSTFALRNFKQTLKKLKTDTDVDLTIEYREIIKQRSSSQINILEK